MNALVVDQRYRIVVRHRGKRYSGSAVYGGTMGPNWPNADCIVWTSARGNLPDGLVRRVVSAVPE